MSNTLYINEESKATEDFRYLEEKIIHLRLNNKNFIGEIIDLSQDRIVSLCINGRNYHVKVENELDRLIDELGLSILSKKEGGDIYSPMPGLVLDILVKPGEQVSEGQPILILEAMKMENFIKALGEGVIREVKVKKGDKIEKDQLLISVKSPEA